MALRLVTQYVLVVRYTDEMDEKQIDAHWYVHNVYELN